MNYCVENNLHILHNFITSVITTVSVFLLIFMCEFNLVYILLVAFVWLK